MKSDSNFEISPSSKIEKQGEINKIKVQMKQIELGWFGKIFGGPRVAQFILLGLRLFF